MYAYIDMTRTEIPSSISMSSLFIHVPKIKQYLSSPYRLTSRPLILAPPLKKEVQITQTVG